ncbi:MAG TPA: porin family protein [Anseongella sp.]
MKKILILIAFVSVSSLAGAQNFELGLKAHPVFGWIKSGSDRMGSDGGTTGFSYGLMGDFYISERYSFATGLGITSTGGKVREPNDVGNTVLSKYRLQYVEVPLTLRLKTDQNGPFVFYGLFGLEGAVNVKASAERTILDLEDPGMKTDQGKLNVDDEITAFRLGLSIGGGAMYDLSGNTRLLLGLTFNNGFTDVFEGDHKGTASYIALNFGVFF